jgi:uncharacterized protein (UPF0261 family)
MKTTPQPLPTIKNESDLNPSGIKCPKDVLDLRFADAERLPDLGSGGGADHVNMPIPAAVRVCFRETVFYRSGGPSDIPLHPRHITR